MILQAADSAAPARSAAATGAVASRSPVCSRAGSRRAGSRRGPGFDTEIVAEAVVTLAHRGGALMLADPERYPPERVLRWSRGSAASVAGRATAGSV